MKNKILISVLIFLSLAIYVKAPHADNKFQSRKITEIKIEKSGAGNQKMKSTNKYQNRNILMDKGVNTFAPVKIYYY